MSSLQFAPGGNAPVRVERDGIAYLVPAWVVAEDWNRSVDCCDSFLGCHCHRLVLAMPMLLEARAAEMPWSALRGHAELDPDAVSYDCSQCSDSLLKTNDDRCDECVAKGGP